MTVLSLTDIFGAGATQDANSVTFLKAPLVAQGLTASSTNTGESIVVGLIKQWESILNSTTQGTNNDIQITIDDSFQSIVTRNNAQYRQFSKTINLQIVDNTSDIDPDSFL